MCNLLLELKIVFEVVVVQTIVGSITRVGIDCFYFFLCSDEQKKR